MRSRPGSIRNTSWLSNRRLRIPVAGRKSWPWRTTNRSPTGHRRSSAPGEPGRGARCARPVQRCRSQQSGRRPAGRHPPPVAAFSRSGIPLLRCPLTSPSPWSSWDAPTASRMKRTGMPARASHGPVTGLAIPPKDPGNRCAAIISHARARIQNPQVSDHRFSTCQSGEGSRTCDVASPSPERTMRR